MHKYYMLLGFDLGLDRWLQYAEYQKIIDTLRTEKRSRTEIKNSVIEYLKQSLPDKVEEDVWMDVIGKQIDCLSRTLIVEIYDIHHYAGEELKKREKLRHHLLRSKGYTIACIDARKCDEDWKNYVDKVIAEALEEDA